MKFEHFRDTCLMTFGMFGYVVFIFSLIFAIVSALLAPFVLLIWFIIKITQ